MVLNPGFGNIGSPNNLNDLKVTAAHEFLHSIQFGLGVITADANYIEGSAAWIEDEVYDSINDNFQYLWPQWGQSMGAYPETNDAWYGYWLVWRGLTEQYGSGVPGGAEDVMQRMFVNMSKGQKLLPATEKAFAPEYTQLAYVFHQFAVAARFMKPCGGGYVPPFCLEEAALYVNAKDANFPVDGTVTKTQAYTGSIRDDYASNWVKLPNSPKNYPVFVENRSADSSFFWSVACDRGTKLRVDIWAPLEPGKWADLGVNRSGCVGPSYVTITNQHMSAPNPVASPEADYKVWVPYIPMTGTVSWTVNGSASGTVDDVTWSESWTEDGTLTLAMKRDPNHVADYLTVDDGGSSYTIDYSLTRTEYDASRDCTTTWNGSGNGSGLPDSGGFIGSTWPNLDPPNPTDDNPDLLGMAPWMPFLYTETWTGNCGEGESIDESAAGAYYHGIASLPPCVPAGLAGSEPAANGWAFAGAWMQDQSKFDFNCSDTLSVEDGSQTITITGSVTYVTPP